MNCHFAKTLVARLAIALIACVGAWQHGFGQTVVDPLTSDKVVAGEASKKATGGEFTAKGWRATKPGDMLVIELADAQKLEGTVEVDFVGLDWVKANTTAANTTKLDGGKVHFLSMFSNPLGRQRCQHGGTAEDAMWMLRGGTGKEDAKQPRFGDGFLTLASAKGARGCPGSGFIEPRVRLNQSAEEETLPRLPQGWKWEEKKTYTFRVTWSNQAGKWAVYLNEYQVFENEWQGQVQPLKYIFLGKSPDYGTFVGPYYSKLRVYNTSKLAAASKQAKP